METVKTAGSFPRDIEDNIQQLADDLFEIMIPYPYTHALVNTYLVRGNDRDLLIDCGGPKQDDVVTYLAMINRIKQLPVRVAYAGHGSAMDHQEFVDACDHAIDHHNRRIRDVLQVVKKEYRSLPEITYYFTYQGERCRWEKYPVAFHWNLMVEITAYLSHLVFTGVVEMCREKGNLLYRLSSYD